VRTAQKIADILVAAKLLDQQAAQSALQQHQQWGGRLSRLVVELGLATEDEVTNALAKGLGVPRADFSTVDPLARARVDVGLAEQHAVFPLALRDGNRTLVLAMADPTDVVAIDAVAARASLRVVPALAGETELSNAILRHYRNLEPQGGAGWFEPGTGLGSDPGVQTLELVGVRVTGEVGGRPEAPPTPPPTPATGELTAAEQELVARIQQTQRKSAAALQALFELLIEKRLVKPGELAPKPRG
jgi:hypothetical protein